MSTFSLIPKWEYTYAVYAYNKDNDPLTDDGYSTSLYAKYMFHQNATATGGASVKFGTGMFPGTIKGEDALSDAFNTYWVNFPLTIPFFDNTFSWDIMPGTSLTRTYTAKDETDAWGFTYSSRLAWYPSTPTCAIVGEAFGRRVMCTQNQSINWVYVGNPTSSPPVPCHYPAICMLWSVCYVKTIVLEKTRL